MGSGAEAGDIGEGVPAVQARLARRLLSGETELIATAAQRLEDLGERATADRLRRGDLDAVALAARLVPR